eukprot:CAMPEP_0182441732 /NCGR_PEP_ID=MMETSP1172-20130603/720_1 /TAXON_ID=708627 /ORGANISM="Timspurckia oligopyrenoides, Strain CCMP3278" /LENGTH=516 /DNA_ID=CAMNT_0024636215 /DNA_START=110 /DNA_END=1660 /DNA_ORIENTATION=-
MSNERPSKRRKSRFSDVVVPAPINDNSTAVVELERRIGAFVQREESMKPEEADLLPTEKPRKRMSRFSDSLTKQSSFDFSIDGSGSREVHESLDHAKNMKPGISDLTAIPSCPVRTLKVNQKREREKRLKKFLYEDEAMQSPENVSGSFYDPELMHSIKREHRQRELKFIEAGSISLEADGLRARAAVAQVRAQLRSLEIKSAKRTPVLALLSREPILTAPDIEWWDEPYKTGIFQEIISHYIQHPDPPVDAQTFEQNLHPVVGTLVLTRAELQKLRRQRRIAEETERQEAIQMGLAEAPRPKVKLSNLMRVLANEQSQDPTRLEAKVRSEIAQRAEAHRMANNARKLDPEQRREKRMQRVEQDIARGVNASIFYVSGEPNPKTRFKVQINAEQYHLSGCFLFYREFNVVVVEGGSKALRKFTNLMLNRIPWISSDNQSLDLDAGDSMTHTIREVSMSESRCQLVWNGSIQRRSFRDFQLVPLRNQEEIRIYFSEHKASPYWESAKNFHAMKKEKD